MQPRSSRALVVALALVATATALAIAPSRRADLPVALPSEPQAREQASALPPRAATALHEPASESKAADVTGDPEPIDEARKIAVVEGLVRDGVVSDLPKLEATVLAREPEAAPAIIRGVASLAAQGTEQERVHATATLARWLGEESAREGRDAAGNQPNIIEALGALGGPEAALALANALDHEHLDLSVQTLTAQMLAGTGDPHGSGAIERFRVRVTELPPAEDALDQELRDEAIAATTPRRDVP